MRRLTDEELAELEKEDLYEGGAPWTSFSERSGDYGIRDAAGAQVARIHGLERDANHLSCSDLIVASRNALPSLLAEVRELRAFKAQVERVKACPGDSLDECVNGARATLGTRGIDGNCVKCGGLP